jgi:hypothetical protein
MKSKQKHKRVTERSIMHFDTLHPALIYTTGHGHREFLINDILCLRRKSAAARLLALWVRVPPGSWMLACFECCVLSGGGLCDELITRLEGSYRLWCVVVCDMRKSDPRWAAAPQRKKYGLIWAEL